jgi:hypothetical protein
LPGTLWLNVARLSFANRTQKQKGRLIGRPLV